MEKKKFFFSICFSFIGEAPESSRLMGMETATPAGAVTELSEGATRAEDPGLSEAREAAKAVPAESVRRNGHQPVL